MEAVRGVLGEIGAADVPELLAFNKADRDPDSAKRLLAANEGAVVCSGLTGEGIPELLDVVAVTLSSMIPSASAALQSRVRFVGIPLSLSILIAPLKGSVVTDLETSLYSIHRVSASATSRGKAMPLLRQGRSRSVAIRDFLSSIEPTAECQPAPCRVIAEVADRCPTGS